MNARSRIILSALSLIVLTMLVLGRLSAADFVQYDDPQTIATNPAFNPQPQLAKILAYWDIPELNLYIPLTYTVWGALAFVARVDQPDAIGSFLNPWVFHAANVALHCIAVLIVFAIVRSIVTCEAAAWIGAAVFAIHPLQVESVAWASGTKDVLCGLFTFASVFALIRRRQTHRAQWIIIGATFVLAACLSKPTGLVAPAMAVIVDTMIHRTPVRRSIVSLSSWFAIAIVFAIIGMRVQPPLTHETPALWMRPLVALDALAFYARQLIWPTGLSVDYGRTPARVLESGAIWWTWIAPIAVAIIVCAFRRRFIAPLALVVIGVAPVLGLIPFTFQTISTVADHYMYPAMLGIAMLVAMIASIGRVQRWIGFAVVIALSIRSFVAAGAWMNDDTLFANALTVNPRSAFSHTNWGVSFARRGENALAFEHFQAAVTVDPDYAFGHSNLAEMFRTAGRFREAAQEYRELLRIYRKQRSVDPQLIAGLERLIAQLENLPAQPASKEAR